MSLRGTAEERRHQGGTYWGTVEERKHRGRHVWGPGTNSCYSLLKHCGVSGRQWEARQVGGWVGGACRDHTGELAGREWW